MSERALSWLEVEACRRSAAGLRRVVSARTTGDRIIDVASNDYLGLGRHPAVTAGAREAVNRWGAGSTGSRLVTGTTADHLALEHELADFVGMPSGLVFSSGYTANLGVVTALAGAGTLIVSDAASHASLVDACRLSGARVVVTPHRDVRAVDAALAARTEARALVLTDSVFSADGALAPLAELHAATRRRGAVLVVDEAHGLGVRGDGGRGLVQECGLAGAPDLVITVTLSKALGSQGGAVLANHAVREHLLNTARTFVFDTALAPASVGAARAALGVLVGDPALVASVRRHATRLARELGLVNAPAAAVVPVVVGDAATAVRAASRCLADGVAVGCFRPPSVAHGSSRLRLTARADLTDDEVATVAAVVRAAVRGKVSV
ncbi:8-amino-7-oxononanoate synthase [Rhodococcus sp. SORGH_AS_0303]|uniref:8-amino-7-oxononanoate synthase n=1 Tax=Rhodococcus sp. SORGH_AS_0303 TaxID=3041753 RepID=UPI0027889BB3|nr:8-amino-7-oxononanoate synthase [Rhodococcus sp. SORGH_AS_0303]MDQ1201032.1 8-amino-7-oxononanoate synthase [Rhodococcus sp. SORGH_AS_0303]